MGQGEVVRAHVGYDACIMVVITVRSKTSAMVAAAVVVVVVVVVAVVVIRPGSTREC